MPSKSIKLFADHLAADLRIMGLSYPDASFLPDPLGGVCRKLARWKVRPHHVLSIYVYAEDYFGGSHNCWVGFGAKNPSPLEIIKPADQASFVQLRPEDWKLEWELLKEDKEDVLRQTSFTAYEDWRPRGWVW